MIHSKKIAIVGLFSTLMFSASQVSAAVVFEGFYKIMNGTQHAGFIVERRESIPNGNLRLTRYISLKDGSSESANLEVDSAFKPLNVYYMTKSGASTRTLRGAVSGGKFTGVETIGQGKKSLEFTVPSQTILDDFVPNYMMAQTKNKLLTGAKYTIARFVDVPGFSVVDARLGNAVNRPGLPGMELIQSPKTLEPARTSVISKDGETLSVKVGEYVATLVGSLNEAAGTIPANTKEVESVFGIMPKGFGPAMTALAAPQTTQPQAKPPK